MKTKLFILITLILSFISCKNEEINFKDFGMTACYFPYQTPIRTLILGNYELGNNENDNNHCFEIGVTMTGVYSNNKDRKVHFQVASFLLDNVANVKLLPEKYYTIETKSPVIIPAGSIKGRIKVQLTEQFFEDSLSFAPLGQVNYVVPLLITDIEKLDTLLTGVSAVPNPSRVNDEDWEILPKDYTLYGVKFINKYDGMYLRRGVDVMTDASNKSVSSIYHAQYVERDELVNVTTTGKSQVELSNLIRRGSASSPGNVNFELVFDENENCIIRSFKNDQYNVTGSGKFVQNGDKWGGKERDAIYLDYSYFDAANNEIHEVKDTLVIRDRAVVFEEFKIELKEK